MNAYLRLDRTANRLSAIVAVLAVLGTVNCGNNNSSPATAGQIEAALIVPPGYTFTTLTLRAEGQEDQTGPLPQNASADGTFRVYVTLPSVDVPWSGEVSGTDAAGNPATALSLPASVMNEVIHLVFYIVPPGTDIVDVRGTFENPPSVTLDWVAGYVCTAHDVEVPFVVSERANGTDGFIVNLEVTLGGHHAEDIATAVGVHTLTVQSPPTSSTVNLLATATLLETVDASAGLEIFSRELEIEVIDCGPGAECTVNADCNDNNSGTTDVCHDGHCDNIPPSPQCTTNANCADGFGFTVDACHVHADPLANHCVNQITPCTANADCATLNVGDGTVAVTDYTCQPVPALGNAKHCVAPVP